jgi:hypothetical protein
MYSRMDHHTPLPKSALPLPLPPPLTNPAKSNLSVELERKFTLFPKLPPELRLKIWRYAIPGKQISILPWLEPSQF